MKAAHIALAVLVAGIWGIAFVATRLGLESFTPPQLTVLRFAIACLPALVLARPPVPWPTLILLGLFLFAGQFLLLFFAMVRGMPPGLASIVTHMQALFTILVAALVLSDLPTRRQLCGIAVSFAGLLLVGMTTGQDLTYLGLALTLAGAASWAVGNVMLKRLGRLEMLPLVVWLSLIPPLPALLLSALFEGPAALLPALAEASWISLAATLYLALVSTIFAYAVWGHLLRAYPTALVAPFALLAPCTGVLASALVYGERFGPLRALGMGLIMAGLAVTVVPSAQLARLGTLVRIRRR